MLFHIQPLLYMEVISTLIELSICHIQRQKGVPWKVMRCPPLEIFHHRDESDKTQHGGGWFLDSMTSQALPHLLNMQMIGCKRYGDVIKESRRALSVSSSHSAA